MKDILPQDTPASDLKSRIIAELREGKLNQATTILDEHRVELLPPDWTVIIEALSRKADKQRLAGDFWGAKRTDRRMGVLIIFRDFGLDLDRLIPLVDIKDGYCGKILLVAITEIDRGIRRVCLRSGEDYHQEILTSAEIELEDLGLSNYQAQELGGALVDFRDDGAIAVWGASDQFGPCDKEVAADLIRQAFPGRKVEVW